MQATVFGYMANDGRPMVDVTSFVDAIVVQLQQNVGADEGLLRDDIAAVLRSYHDQVVDLLRKLEETS